ncbi:MAG: hypothetical protein ACRD3O_06000, partial [Terriglobia bacterium]
MFGKNKLSMLASHLEMMMITRKKDEGRKRSRSKFVVVAALAAVALGAQARGVLAAQQRGTVGQIQEDDLLAPPPGSHESPEITRVVNGFIARENYLVRTLQNYTPRMEIYIQDMRNHPELGAVPVNDYYFLGRVQLRPNKTIAVRSLLPQRGFGDRMVKHIKGQITQFISPRYHPSDFYFSLVMDTTRF